MEPPAFGKTSVGRALAALGRNAACVHGDQLRAFIVKRIDSEVGGQGLGYVNGGAVVANFIAAGYDLVVFNVFEQPRHVKKLVDAGLLERRALDTRPLPGARRVPDDDTREARQASRARTRAIHAELAIRS
jgi:hypothetical protein